MYLALFDAECDFALSNRSASLDEGLPWIYAKLWKEFGRLILRNGKTQIKLLELTAWVNSINEKVQIGFERALLTPKAFVRSFYENGEKGGLKCSISVSMLELWL